MRTRFWHYHSRFDAIETVTRHAMNQPPFGRKPGRVMNFLGVAIDPQIFPSALEPLNGFIEAAPMPNNWHADLAEWAAALHAVDLSGPTFTMMELGCGWGCWMLNTGVAARRTGRAVRVIGVEGDAGHIAFAQAGLAENGFADSESILVTGIAAGRSGVALFPLQEAAGESWGLEPVLDADEARTQELMATGRYTALPMISLEEISRDHPRVDLLHIDIQGGEVDLVASCLDILSAKFAYVLIGTHSRQIEGRLFGLMIDAGWELDMERPAFLDISHPMPIVTVDGVQGWKNPRLFQA
ncbi:class I SAM-dependent methyltransferase [Brevundimonas sp. AJA228-03]|uniref:hypothetical protein n=1 Tax=Brevundimonas sp. AJA228-03 TaxID=2752515 RepID=UPI001ADFA2EB|nr:hypothetical protein [Brevundimonas sp. AJA228-03]QTN20246.1 class I SAM-dependent methyltransferase [Brevundimonas sp. AJA228-03]